MHTCRGGRARCSLSATPAMDSPLRTSATSRGDSPPNSTRSQESLWSRERPMVMRPCPLTRRCRWTPCLSSILAAVRLAGVDTHRDEVEQPPSAVSRTQIPGTVADLLAEGLLHAGVELHCTRAGKHGVGTVAPDGQIIVNGVGYTAPSLAAGISLGATSSAGYGGWEIWHVGSLAGPKLADLRSQLPKS